MDMVHENEITGYKDRIERLTEQNKDLQSKKDAFKDQLVPQEQVKDWFGY